MDAISKLTQLETTIANGLETFIDVGTALKAIRDEKLFRDGYESFQEYVTERWGWSRSHAYRLIDLAAVSHARDKSEQPTSIRDAERMAKEDRAKDKPNNESSVVESEIVYEGAEAECESKVSYDESCVRAFEFTELRLATLKQIVSMLTDVEIQVLKDWISD